MNNMTVIAHKQQTDRERYEMHRNQALHTYERAVENAQYLYAKINEKKRKFQELEAELDGLEDDHERALENVKETEEKMTKFIKTMRHFRDDA